MNRWVWWAGRLGTLAIVFLAPELAWADNCSSLGDCWSSFEAAVCAAAGAGSLPFWDKVFGGDQAEGPDLLPPEGGDPMDDPCTQ